MRGEDQQQGAKFSYLSPEQRDYHLLFRWFVGLHMDDTVWGPTVFSKNRDRLLAGDIAGAFFEGVVAKLREKHLLSDEHFTVDGTLLEAWAGAKSFRRKEGQSDPPEGGRNPTVDFHGEKRTSATHQSTTDAEARLAKKTKCKEAKLSDAGHVLMENRNGLIVTTRVTQATGTAECEAALEMIEENSGRRRITAGGDKGYDQKKFVDVLRQENVTAHVARNELRPGGSAIDKRTTRHEGYEISQRVRKRVEEIFGWMKTIGMLRKLRHGGEERIGWMFTFTAAACNPVRARNLLAKTNA